jgi:hypothetical protein
MLATATPSAGIPAMFEVARHFLWHSAGVSAGERPSGVVTFLFTDIEGSTLTVAGCDDEAMAASDSLVVAADATGNPCALANALLAYGFAFRATDPARALDALRRSRAIAQDTGTRWNESHLAVVLSGLEADYGDPLAALDCFIVAIRNYHDSGNTTMIRSPLAVLSTFFDWGTMNRRPPSPVSLSTSSPRCLPK